MFSQFTQVLLANTRTTAGQQVFIEYLQSPSQQSHDKAQEQLQKIMADTLTPSAEILNPEGIPVITASKNGLDIHTPLYPALSAVADNPQSGLVGRIYRFGDSMYYPVIVAVAKDNKLLGYLVRWRMLTTTPKQIDDLSKLIGAHGRLYFGNNDGKFWTDALNPVPIPLLDLKDTTKVFEYTRTPGDLQLGVIQALPHTDWLILVEFPGKEIFKTANQFLRWIIIIGAILLAIGILAAWLMSRNISHPVKLITGEALALATGSDAPSLVYLERKDELGTLSTAFNIMAERVIISQKQLRHEAENYKLLFTSNPMPMWILSKATLDILDVNEAALRHYGYTRDEFLQLRSVDLRPAPDVKKYLNHVNAGITSGTTTAGIWRHKKKDGSTILVDVIADDLTYKNEPARIILAHDVTEKLRAEAELVSIRIQQQKIITETTIQAQEKEREEIGKELHDNINQILASAKLYLELGLQKKEDPILFQKTNENIDLAIEEIRQLSQSLVAPSLGNVSLVGIIKELIDKFTSATALTFHFELEDFNEEMITDDLRLSLYRIIQEQVNNILKHAEAKNVFIKLGSVSGQVVLSIRDDGIGFDPSASRSGIGLRNITNRAKFYSGDTQIISAPQQGTTLTITIPFPVN